MLCYDSGVQKQAKNDEKRRADEWLATYKVGSSLPSFWHLCDAQGQDGATHSLPILIFIELSIKIELEVHKLCRAERHYDLTFVGRCAHDSFSLRYSPFVDSSIRKNVSYTMRMNLQECVGADLLDCECWSGGQETGILDFLNRLSNTEYESTIHEGQNDVGIKGVCPKLSSR